MNEVIINHIKRRLESYKKTIEYNQPLKDVPEFYHGYRAASKHYAELIESDLEYLLQLLETETVEQ